MRLTRLPGATHLNGREGIPRCPDLTNDACWMAHLIDGTYRQTSCASAMGTTGVDRGTHKVVMSSTKLRTNCTNEGGKA